VYEWLFFEQYSHEPYIATVRYWVHIARGPNRYAAQIAERMPRGDSALGVLNERLDSVSYLVGDAFTVADIALYAYTHVADEAGLELARYPALAGWMRRCEQQPRFVPMRRRPRRDGRAAA
jgi:glutathione S-transferase